MKSTHVSPAPDMRGKKSYAFRCGCCDAYDLRDKVKAREAENEMQQARRGLDAWDDQALADWHEMEDFNHFHDEQLERDFTNVRKAHFAPRGN
jgi:hypothetical protein